LCLSFFHLNVTVGLPFRGKYYAYVEPVNGGQLHSGHTYRVRFGGQLKYPVIEEIIEEIVL
jgi:hypothetical protein